MRKGWLQTHRHAPTARSHPRQRPRCRQPLWTAAKDSPVGPQPQLMECGVNITRRVTTEHPQSRLKKSTWRAAEGQL